MAEWIDIRAIRGPESPEGFTEIVSQKSLAGDLHRYIVRRWWHPAEIEEGLYDEGYWSITEVSGLFSTLDDCEREADAVIPWLRQRKTNT